MQQFCGEIQKKMLDAAKAMKLSAKDLLELNVIDEIIKEPIGGAHRDKDLILKNVQDSLSSSLDYFQSMSGEEVFNNRKNKFLKIGRNKGFVTNTADLSSLKVQNNEILEIFQKKKLLIPSLVILILVMVLVFL